jgi:hypothetical protein
MPKLISNKAFRPLLEGKGSFSQALNAIKDGYRVRRCDWDTKNAFLFLRPADELEVGFIIDKVKSLPDSVKHHFQQIVDSGVNEESKNYLSSEKIKFTAYLCMYMLGGSIINGWSPSQVDMLSEDWSII